MGAQWRIRLLGGFTLQRDGGEILRPQSGRVAALLATLAYRPGAEHPRHLLAEALWPDADETAGLHCLRQAIVGLRRILEPPGVEPGSLVLASRASVQLDAHGVTTDVQEFRDAVEALDRTPPGARLDGLDRVVRAYGGELLPSLSDEWVLIERERLSAAYLRAVHQMIALLESADQPERAMEYALMAVAAAPSDEECAVAAMRLSARMGRPPVGLQAYKALCSALRRLGDAAPGAATRALARELRRMEQGRPTRAVAGEPPRVESPRNRLPHRGKPLIGRDKELAELAHLLRSAGGQSADGGARSRLVWLTGPAGCGKTRLAAEAAQTLAGDYGSAVWFVPLADVSDPDRIAPTILDRMGGPKAPGSAPMHQVAERLSAQPSLLVLDNLEHLQERCAGAILDLVDQTPSLVVLVTSRERLRAAGVVEVDLQPLPTPPRACTPVRLLEYPAVRLFVERARAVAPGFDVTTGNAAAVAALCRRLDGLPLAIELAAARSGVLTPSQMLSELAGKADLLVARRADPELRHRALSEAIAWSYRRLPENLQRLFPRLSVFRGGWSLDAARYVCDDPGALDSLEILWERSMITARESGDEMRFGMLETMRQFADERLEPAERSQVEERHAQYYLRLAERAGVGISSGIESTMWMARLDPEHENLRSALARLVLREEGLRMANALGRYWRIRGDYADGRDWLTRALEASPGAPPLLRSLALMNRGMLALHAGQHSAAEADLGASAALCPEHGDERILAETLVGLGAVDTAFGRFDRATDRLERSLALWASLGDRLGQATALGNLGRVAERRGDLETAARHYARSAEMYREAGDERRAALAFANTGTVLGMQDRPAEAQAVFERCIPVFRRVGDRSGLAVALVNLAESLRAQGHPDAARPLLQEAVPIQLELGDRLGVLLSVWILANLRDPGDAATTACLLSAVETIGQAEGLLAPHELEQLRSDEETTKARLTSAQYEAARQMGRSLSLQEAIDAALTSAELPSSEIRAFSIPTAIEPNP